MPKSSIPKNVTDLMDRLAATADRLGSYVALTNVAGTRDPKAAAMYRDKATANQRELDAVKRELAQAIESYGSQLYDGGLELGRAEGAR